MKWLAALALCCVAPAAAQQSEVPNFRAMSDAELLERATAVINTGFYNACNNESPLFAELARRNPRHLGYKSGALIGQAVCASEEGRLEEALSLVKQSESVLPVPIQNTVGLDLAIRLKDGSEALAQLRKIAAGGRIRYLNRDFLFAGLDTISVGGLGDELDELAYELTAASEFAQIEPDVQGAFAIRGFRHAAKRGDLSRVDMLLEHIFHPEAYTYMLADRVFEPAWPQIEEYAGDHLEKVTSSFVAWSAQRLADDPDDRDRLSLYANALLFAGRDEEAATLAGDWLAGTEDNALQEGDAWALEVQVRALDALGRTAEADAVFDRLARSRPEQPWIVNFLINRAIRLRSQGRWQDALEGFALARPTADERGTDYARLLVAAGRACALHRLGRDAEVEPEVAHLIEHSDTHLGVAAGGLLCAERRADAEQLIAKGFEDDDNVRRLVDTIQDKRFDMRSFRSISDPSEPSLSVRDLILEREDLRLRVLKHVRLLPDHLVPIGYLRREERRASQGGKPQVATES